MSENIQEKIEYKIIDLINLNAGGRLIIFKSPNKDDKKLIIEKRGEYENNRKIFFQVNRVIKKGDVFLENILKKDFSPREDFYLVFLYFDEILQKISDYIWLVPSLKFESLAEPIKSSEGENFLKFEAPVDTKAENKYSKLLIDKNNLGDFLIDIFGKNRKIDHSKDFLKKNII